jgi:hypothetical protein
MLKGNQVYPNLKSEGDDDDVENSAKPWFLSQGDP